MIITNYIKFLFLYKHIYNFYIIYGNEYYLLHKCKNLIKKQAFKNNFNKYIFYFINKKFKWNKLIKILNLNNLFYNKILLVILIDSLNFNKRNYKNIKTIINILNKKIILILKIIKLEIQNKNSKIFINKIFRVYKKNSILINCFYLNNYQIYNLLKFFLKKRKVILSKKNILILCFYIEIDLSFFKILELLSIKDNKFNNILIKNIIYNENICFDYFNFIDSLFNNNLNKFIYILENNIDIIKLNSILIIKLLQKYFYLFFILKYFNNFKIINYFLRKNFYLKNKISIIKNKISIINKKKLYKIFSILIDVEINIKNKNNFSILNKFKELFIFFYNDK